MMLPPRAFRWRFFVSKAAVRPHSRGQGFAGAGWDRRKGHAICHGLLDSECCQSAMIYVALGAAGFLLAYFFDHPRIEKVRWAKLAIGLVAFGLLGYSLVMAAAYPDRFQLPTAVSVIGWVFASVFLLLFIYSVFVEIPFSQAYLGKTKSSGPVTTGTYALTRHPGVIWCALTLIFLVLATGSKVLAWACPIWVLMNLIWVCIEDRFYFVKTIPGYDQYKKEVPMLVPTLGSVRNCVKSFWRQRVSP